MSKNLDLPSLAALFRDHRQMAISLCWRIQFAAEDSRCAGRITTSVLSISRAGNGASCQHVPRISWHLCRLDHWQLHGPTADCAVMKASALRCHSTCCAGGTAPPININTDVIRPSVYRSASLNAVRSIRLVWKDPV